MDRFIRSVFLEAGFREIFRDNRDESVALAALGSYGRRELCYGSDVDLMVIHRGRLSPEMSDIIPRALYPLWDAKLEVGHSVLSVQECVRLALGDFRSLTSFLDARFIMGSRAFYRLFREAFRSRIQREKHLLLGRFLMFQEKREERYNTQEYFIEPDIKDGPGGLRDLHLMAWMAAIYFNLDRLQQIRRFSVFSHFRMDKLVHSKEFLLKVRNHLHLLVERREDRLLLPFQKKIARELGYTDGPDRTGVEKFMRHLYLHLNRVRHGSSEFLTKAVDLIDPRPFDPSPDRLPEQFRVMKGNIVLRDDIMLGREPLLILKAFSEANRLGIFLGSGFIWEAGRIIAGQGKNLRASPEAGKLFLDLVFNPVNPGLLRLALEIGLITAFIPEFRYIRNLIQFGYYHAETVDLHSLKTLEILNAVRNGVFDERWPLFREVFTGLEHPERLFLAALLHDIGKGFPGDHSEKGAELVPRILERLGIKGEVVDTVCFLIRHHLLLAHISRARDLNEEKTSVQAAQIVQGPENLSQLFLLTVADSIATGPMASSDWKIMLLTELYFKVKGILERGVLATPDATRMLEEKKKNLLERLRPGFDQAKVLHLMEQVSERYFLNSPLEIMERHFKMALTMGDEKFLWSLEKLKDAPVTRMVLCTYDRPGLFSKMVGVLTLNGVKVLSANISTLKNGLAFDIYEVTNPLDIYRESERWDKIRREVLLVLEDGPHLEELIKRKGRSTGAEEGWGFWGKKVRVENDVSDFFTVIEVKAAQRIGLLYELARAIHELNLDIRYAKVNSDKEKAMGVFYVRDAEGQKIYEQSEIKRIEETLMGVLS